MSDPFQFIPKGNNKHLSILQEMLRHIASDVSIPSQFFNSQPIPLTKGTKVMWAPHGGQPICVTEMSTRHLFFALRLVYNTLIRRDLALDFDNKRHMRFPTSTEGKRVLAGMFEEIRMRDNLTESQLNDLTFMAKNTKIHL